MKHLKGKGARAIKVWEPLPWRDLEKQEEIHSE
jgi:hypothetical protein